MKKKSISFILAFSLLIPLLSPMNILAKDESASSTPSATQPLPTAEEAAASAESATPDAVSEAELLADCAILKHVGAEAFRAAGHVTRLPQLETLSSYAFRNADGTHTVYYLDQPVKYIDAAGEIQTIDLSLQSDGAVYRPTASKLSLTMAKSYSDGVTLSYNRLSATLIAAPVTTGKLTESVAVTTRANGESLTYQNAFGKNIDLRYTALYNGVKEDIILQSYTGQSSFTFLLRTEGLTLYSEKGGYYLAPTATAKERIDLGQVVAYDAEADMYEGKLHVTTVEAGALYQLTVSVDADWLSAKDTKYPVIIDPTLTYHDESAADAILDAPVFNLKPTQNFGSYTYNRVGYYSGWGIGRTVVRPDGMLNSTLYQNLHASQVNSVLFTVTEATGSANQTIQIHKLYNGEGWTESNVTYDNMGFSCGVVTTAQLGNNAETTFDLTDLVKEWINGTNVASNGFMMKGVNENTVNKAFCSTEYGTVSMRPYMTLNYTPIIDVVSSVTTVNVGSSITLTANVEPEDAIVTWSSGNNSIATVNSTGVVTGVHAGSVIITATAGDESASIELLVTIPDGAYYIQNNYSNLYLACEMSWANTLDVSQRGNFPLEPSSTRIMWRIHHLGNGLYSLRPLCNLNHGLTFSSSYGVQAFILDPNDSLQLSETAQWQIAYAEIGYTIKHKGYDFRTLSLESDTIAIGADIVTGTKTEGLSRQQWSFTAVTREYNGAIVYDTDTGGIATATTRRYVAVGSTQVIGELEIKATVYSNNSIDQTIYWTSSDSSVAQVNSSTGQVTGVSPGTVTITAQKANASGTGGIGTADSYTVIVPELEDGTYYIRNRQHDKYVQACSALAPDYDTPGYALEQWELDGGTHQRWELELQYNGYYRIRSVISGLYMATQAGGEGTQDLFILQENEVINSPRQLWKIELTSHGSYKIKAKSSEPYSEDLAVVAANIVNGSSNGIQVQQRLYVDNESYKDEWLFSRVTTEIQLEGQQTNVWCWVACARMAASRYMDSQISQASAAVYALLNIKTMSPTETQITTATNTGYPDETQKAIEYLLGVPNIVYYTEFEIYSESTLRSILDSSYPVIIFRGWYNNNVRDSGHATIIYDYHWDPTLNAFMYDIYDPWPVNRGDFYSQSYQSICNGRNAIDDNLDINDTAIWESVVVFKYGNYANTIDWPNK